MGALIKNRNYINGLFLILLFLNSSITGNTQVLTFQKIFAASNDETRPEIIGSQDGNFLVLSGNASFGQETASSIFKVTSTGDTLWTKSFINTVFFSLIELSSGDLLLGGRYYDSSTSDENLLVTKTTSNGTIIWSHTYPIAISEYTFCNNAEIIETDDGGILIAGTMSAWSSSSGSFNFSVILKLNSNGIILWSKKFLAPFEITAIQKNGTGYLIGGKLYNDFAIILVDDLGNYQCLNSFINAGVFSELYEIGSNNFLITTRVSGNPVLILIDSLANFNSAVTYNSINGYFTNLSEKNNQLFFSGSDGYELAFLMSTDPNGIPIWSKKYDYPPAAMYGFKIHDFKISDTKDIFIASTINYDITWGNSELMFIKTDSTGHVSCNETDMPLTLSNISVVTSGFSLSEATYSISLDTVTINSSFPNLMIQTYCENLDTACSVISTDTVIACNSFTWINGNTYSSDNNTATFIFSVANGCDSIKTLNLTITNIDTSVTVSGNALTANEGNASYQWIDCATNLPLSGETDSSINVINDGIYAVIISANGCVDTGSCISMIDLHTLSLMNKKISTINLSPNPSHGKVALHFDKHFIESEIQVAIYDLPGNIVQSFKGTLNNDRFEIDNTNLANGTYNCYVIINNTPYALLKMIILK